MYFYPGFSKLTGLFIMMRRLPAELMSITQVNAEEGSAHYAIAGTLSSHPFHIPYQIVGIHLWAGYRYRVPMDKCIALLNSQHL